MKQAPVIRLHLYFATQNDRAVILRQGPSEVFRMILWHRDEDRFEDGQWLKQRLYTERCALSPDGRHFLYFTLDNRWNSEAGGSYTVISRPPWFTALALFPIGHTWGGGGFFIDNTTFVADGRDDIIGEATGLRRAFDSSRRWFDSQGDCLADRTKVDFPMPDGPPPIGRTRKSLAFPRDAYDTQGGRLYHRRGQDLTLIRDFTDMEFERIIAPYDTRAHDLPGQQGECE